MYTLHQIKNFHSETAGEDTIAIIPAPIHRALDALELIPSGVCPRGEPLTGGVSSDIWLIDLGKQQVCAKRALAKLKVDQAWFAPVERSAHEVAFNQLVQDMWPGRVPDVVGYHTPTATLVSAFLPAQDYPLWKTQLKAGDASTEFTSQVAHFLVDLYKLTCGQDSIQQQFYAPDMIHALRLSPYFLATAEKHPDCADRFTDLVDMFEKNCVALIHGDFSPKNILMGPDGPVILDAECANYGDPAFDAAFCLNHLCLKALWKPVFLEGYRASAEAFLATYLAGVGSQDLARRAAAYLPGLMLARVDGKSPVEYLNEEWQIALVQRFARKHLKKVCETPTTILLDWFHSVSAYLDNMERERI